MKLYGKELDDELARRKQSQKERRDKRITIHEAAKQRGISASDLLAFEYGYDVCACEESEYNIGGFPIPLIIYKECKKCGKVDKIERVTEENFEKAWKIMEWKIIGQTKEKKKKQIESQIESLVKTLKEMED